MLLLLLTMACAPEKRVDSDQAPCSPVTEVCDGVDNDCDGLVDDVDPDIVGLPAWHEDADGDGYGAAASELACTQPPGFVVDDSDCDDTVVGVNPAADEICDDVDNDCDGLADGQDDSLVDGTAFYADRDGDGFGDPGEQSMACTAPASSVLDDTDCDDGQAAINPDADELCDNFDNDCDGLTDGQDDSLVDGTTWYADADGDGFGDPDHFEVACSAPPGSVASGTDCDDASSAVNPGADEICDDLDDDCDALIDGQDDSLTDGTTFYEDGDLDGFGDAGSPLIACSEPSGFTVDDTDCDDTVGEVNPGADEVCDGLDNDCDARVDGLDPSLTDAGTFYQDSDGDGYGDGAIRYVGCTAPSRFVADGTDCDDRAVSVNPGAAEVCNDIDDDCDALTDGRDDSLSDGTTWYADVDDDGYGDPGNVSVACSAPSGFIAEAGDCDDGWTQVNPDALEICDGSDNDCDTLLDGDDDSLSDGTTWFADLDGDGYGDATNPILGCTLPSGYVVGASDCDDTVATIRPCGNCAVTASSPSVWELDVPADGDVTIDADLDGTTVDDTSLVVYGDVSGYIPGSVSYASGRVTFHPDSRAQPGERVTAVLTQTAQCTDGGTPGPVVWTWTAAVEGGTGVLYDAGIAETHVNNWSYSITANDFDGDGDLELATADANSDTVTIYGGAPGAYVVGQQVDSGSPSFLVGADVDRDGDIDLVISEFNASLAILLNDGAGSFADPAAVDASPHQNFFGVRAADMDGDGDLDLVAASTYQDAVLTFLNDGDGAFTLFSETPVVGIDQFPLDVGDLDGDGDLDLIASSGGVGVFLNDGTGRMTAGAEYAAGNTPKGLYINDLDGDGIADAALPALYSDLLYTFVGDGAGAFTTSSLSVPRGHSICGGDLDNDGDLDLVVPQIDHYTVSTVLNDGAGGFRDAQTLPTVRSALAAVCADLNGDGALDVAVTGASDGFIAPFLNTP